MGILLMVLALMPMSQKKAGQATGAITVPIFCSSVFVGLRAAPVLVKVLTR